MTGRHALCLHPVTYTHANGKVSCLDCGTHWWQHTRRIDPAATQLGA